MQLGFVLDKTRCIGCHACTVACKSENDVPLGDFRTWVKYTEAGHFPEVKRSFTVLRCNQCSDAPCVTICPVTALDKRPDGIVDLDRDVCIGCKACMQGCPYDALYLNESTGTAEKCHFCAHRTEQGLAPACAVVCPTEAIIPGDFDDGSSVVARMREQYELSVRKPEAGTSPNVYYREGAPEGIDPGLTSGAGGFLWSQRREGPQQEAEAWLDAEHKAEGRTVYNVDRKPLWGFAITGYLFAKSLCAGVPLVALVCGGGQGWLTPLLGLLALAVTMVLLVADLKRPERFLSILLRPNWNSWLAKGSYVLMAWGGLLGAWTLGWIDPSGSTLLALVCLVVGALAAGYTAWLFGQAKGRVLWMRKGLFLHLLVQAAVAGSALLMIVANLSETALPGVEPGALAHVLRLALAVHLGLTLSEKFLAPAGREAEYGRAAALISHGPFARQHWVLGVVLGGALPLVLLALLPAGGLWALAGLLALVGLWSEEDTLVRAGQALPIS